MRQIRLICLFLGLTVACGALAQDAVPSVDEKARPCTVGSVPLCCRYATGTIGDTSYTWHLTI